MITMDRYVLLRLRIKIFLNIKIFKYKNMIIGGILKIIKVNLI